MYKYLTNKGVEVASRVDILSSSVSNVDEKCQKLEQLIKENSENDLETATQIYAAIKELSNITKESDKQISNYVGNLEDRYEKSRKRIKCLFYLLGASNTITLIISIVALCIR